MEVMCEMHSETERDLLQREELHIKLASFQETQPISVAVHLRSLAAHRYTVTLCLCCLRTGSIVLLH